MHEAVAARRRRLHRVAKLAHAFVVTRAKRAQPFAIDGRRARRCGGDDCVECIGAVRQDFDVAATVVPQLRCGVCDAQETRIAEHGRRSIRKLEVEPPADGQHDVGFADRRASHRAHARRMPLRHDAAALAGVEMRGAESIQQSRERRTGSTRAAPADHERPSRRPQHVGRRAREVCTRRGRCGRLRAKVLVALHCARHVGAQRVDRKIEIDRTGLAAFAVRTRDGLVQLLQRQRRLAHAARVTRDRTHEVGVDDILKRAAIFLRARRRSRQHQQRGLGDVRVRDAGHRVGHTRTGGDERDAELAAELAVRVRHVDGRALVAHVDDRDALGIDAHPHRHDVAAAQAENAIDAARLEEARDDGGDAVVREFHVESASMSARARSGGAAKRCADR